MIKTYKFSKEKSIEFEDSKSVKELIEQAFEKFGYYEPLGIDAVTVFQPHSTRTNTGWFTVDTSRSCAEEIEFSDGLCFGYYIPNTFYYAEGGWGHHMMELGNRPNLPESCSLKIKISGVNETIVFNGNLLLIDVITMLKKATYIPEGSDCIRIFAVYSDTKIRNNNYTIPFSNSMLHVKIKDFDEMISQQNSIYLEDIDNINYCVIEFM